MPEGVTGRQASIAYSKFGASSWGVAASVTRGVYFTNFGGIRPTPARVNDEAHGQRFLGRGDLGDHAAQDVEFVGRSRYDDWQYALDAFVMGSAAAPTIVTSTATAPTSWLHVLDLATAVSGVGITIAEDKSRYVDELTSAKVYGFGEAVGDDGVMDKTYKVLGTKPTNVSSININSTVAASSYPALSNRILRSQGIFRMNVQGASALAAGDAVQAETIEFMFERPQDAPFIFGSDAISEPQDSGWPVVELKIAYPRMNQTSADSLYAALRTNPIFKADWTFTGALINSTDSLKRLYQFPALELDEWSDGDAEGADQFKPTATFRAKLAASSPAGMPFVNPFRLSITNTNSIGAFQ